MLADEPVNLNLKEAPLIVSLAALEAGSSQRLIWPDKLQFSQFKLSGKRLTEVNHQLDWIKRQYEALLKNPKTQAYAPHVLPYLALTTLHISAPASRFAQAVSASGDYQLTYLKNLTKALATSLGIASQPAVKVRPPAGPLMADRTRFRVVEYQPLNELEAGFRQYYEKSGLAYTAAYESWLEQKFDLKETLLQRQVMSGQAQLRYQLEVVLEPQLLIEGQKLGMFTIDAVQAPTPSHGYALPKQIADGGMIERCFDISFELYSGLAASDPLLAPLVCLWGHRQRALISTGLTGLTVMARTESGRNQRLAQAILTKLAEKHPLSIAVVTAEFGPRPTTDQT